MLISRIGITICRFGVVPGNLHLKQISLTLEQLYKGSQYFLT